MSAKHFSQTGVLRAIDANLNRAAEGLRVVEDVFRFSFDDLFLAERLKTLRHSLADLNRKTRRIAPLSIARDSQNDVGLQIDLPSERNRSDLESLIDANLVRVAQALRSLEEHGKLLDMPLSKHFEKLRYEVYELEKVAHSIRLSCKKLDSIHLCLLVACQPTAEAFAERLERLLEAEVPLMIQLRDKVAKTETLLDRGRILSRRLAGTPSLWIMNDRADLAVACEADGVHVGQEDLPLKDCRKIVGVHKIVGVSTHVCSEAEAAVNGGANYIGVGPMFPSQTKSFEHFPGPPFAQTACSKFRLPLFAIGGVQASNLDTLRKRGVTRVALSNAIQDVEQPAKLISEFHRALIPNSFEP